MREGRRRLADEELVKKIREGTWKNPELKGANLKGADLRGVNLKRADLQRAKLSMADLQGATLQGANLKNVALQEAKLQGADLQGSNLLRANLQGANLLEANLHGANLRNAQLQASILQLANLEKAFLQRAKLFNSNLVDALLREANLKEAILRGADLQRANLEGADLRKADLREANLKGSDLQITGLTGTDLQGVDLQEANLQGAHIDEVTKFSLPNDFYISDDVIWRQDDKDTDELNESIENGLKPAPELKVNPHDRIYPSKNKPLTEKALATKEKSRENLEKLRKKLHRLHGMDEVFESIPNTERVPLTKNELDIITYAVDAAISLHKVANFPPNLTNALTELMHFLKASVEQLQKLCSEEIDTLGKSKLLKLTGLIGALTLSWQTLQAFITALG